MFSRLALPVVCLLLAGCSLLVLPKSEPEVEKPRPGSAEELLLAQETAEASPSDAEAQYELCELYVGHGSLYSALEACGRAAEADPLLLGAHRHLIDIYFSLHAYAEAAGAAKRIIELEPDSAETYSRLGVAYRELDRFEEAIAALEEAVRLDGTRDDFHLALGITYLDLGDYSKAIPSLEEAIRIAPEAVQNTEALDHARAALEEDLALYRRYVAVHPNIGASHALLGVAYQEAGLHEEAIIELDAAVELLRAGADNAAGESDSTGQADEAGSMAGTATAKRAGSAHETDNSANADETDEATEGRDAGRIDEDRLLLARTLYNRGLALSALGRREEAIESFTASAATGTETAASAHYKIGVIQLALDDPESAVGSLRESVRLAPEALGNRRALVEAYYGAARKLAVRLERETATDVADEDARQAPTPVP